MLAALPGHKRHHSRHRLFWFEFVSLYNCVSAGLEQDGVGRVGVPVRPGPPDGPRDYAARQPRPSDGAGPSGFGRGEVRLPENARTIVMM